MARDASVPFVDARRAFAKAAPPGAPVFTHLTADFIHHPNQYGQKIYFSLLVPYFLPAATDAAAIPDYVIERWTGR